MQVSEGRIIAALRDEVTAAEVRLEEERAAHTATQRSAAAREQVGAATQSHPFVWRHCIRTTVPGFYTHACQAECADSGTLC